MPSASAMQASLPHWMITPCRRSSTHLAVDERRTWSSRRDGAPPLRQALSLMPIFVVELDVALLDRVEDDLRRHQLRQAGGRDAARRRSSRTARCRWRPRSGSRSAHPLKAAVFLLGRGRHAARGGGRQNRKQVGGGNPSAPGTAQATHALLHYKIAKTRSGNERILSKPEE